MKAMETALLFALLVSTSSAIAADDSDKCKPASGTRTFEFTSGENKLHGFVDVPAGEGPFPAVLILHGSGDTDVFAHDSEYNGHYHRLRDTFRSAGFATVIWDKAGSGCSSGKYSNGNPIRERASETVAALNALKFRSDIDSKRMGLWGISQGGWVAPMVAVRTPEVRFLILVSAPADDAVSQVRFQTRRTLERKGVSSVDIQTIDRDLGRAFALMRAGGSLDEFVSAVQALDKYPVLQDLGITRGTPEDYKAWQNSMDHQYRPDTALRELQQPVLAIFGEQDELVDWRESEQILKKALKSAGNSDLTIKVFRNADHNLFRVGSREFINGYLVTVRDWLRIQSRRTRRRD